MRRTASFILSMVILFMCFALSAAIANPQMQAPGDDTVIANSSDTLSAKKLGELIKSYSRQGNHRAGTSIDSRSASWLRQVFQRSKIPVTTQLVTFVRPMSSRATVVVKVDRKTNRTLQGVPLYNAAVTGGSAVKSKLGVVGEENIVPVFHLYLMLPNQNFSYKFLQHNWNQFQQLIHSNKYPAILVVTEGAAAGLAMFNVNLDKIVNTPVVLLSNHFGSFLEMQAKINFPVKIVSSMKKKRVTAKNIIAKIQGTDPDARPIVVLTPRSAWWAAAAERGTGLAAWIAVARKVHEHAPKHTVYFVTTSGHELGSLGMKEFVAKHGDLVKNGIWVYIGDNMGSTQPVYLVNASTRSLRKLAKQALSQYGVKHYAWIKHQPAVSRYIGNVLRNGSNKFIAFESISNQCYHQQCDKWPTMVNPEAQLRFTKILYMLVSQLANS